MAGAQKKAPGATDRSERKAEKKAPDTWQMEPAGSFEFPHGIFFVSEWREQEGPMNQLKSRPKHGVWFFFLDEEGGKCGGVFSILKDLMWGSD